MTANASHPERSPAAGLRPSASEAEPRRYGYWAFVLRRLARDRTVLASVSAIAVILLAVFAGAPLAAGLLGHGPDDPFPYAVDASNNPAGPLSRVPEAHTSMHGGPPERTTLLVLGADGTLGRDELLPHVAPLLLVYGTLIMATNIILEASITFLGMGCACRLRAGAARSLRHGVRCSTPPLRPT